MKIDKNDAVIRQELLSKILNNKSQETNTVTYDESEAANYANNASKASNDSVNIGLSQYINTSLSQETLAAERQEKIAKLKELYEKGEYQGAEAKELAKSLVEGINEEIDIARNSILFTDEDE